MSDTFIEALDALKALRKIVVSTADSDEVIGRFARAVRADEHRVCEERFKQRLAAIRDDVEDVVRKHCGEASHD